LDLLYKDIIEKIIQCFYSVYNELGYGFLKVVYRNALLVELRNNNIFAEAEKNISIEYKGIIVGDYRADIVIEEKIIIEVKAVKNIIDIHELQLLII